MRPNISIIVPFNTGSGMLRAALKSLHESIQKGDEIIIVINSVNEPEPLVDDICADARIFRATDKKGHGFTCNFGASCATNAYIVFCDHDMIFESDWLDNLWHYYASDENIGAVSCCILNPHTFRILDFGISYTQFNGCHTFQDLPYKHPLAARNVDALAICTGGFLIARQLFHEVGGFDHALYIYYTDIDLCLRLRRRGYKVGAAWRAVAYHFGGQISIRARVRPELYVRGDAKGYLNWRHADQIVVDWPLYLAQSADFFTKAYGHLGSYYAYSLMSMIDPQWYVDQFDAIGATVHDFQAVSAPERDSSVIGLYELLGHDVCAQKQPIAYFVDRFVAINQNRLWWRERGTQHDIVVDRHANIFPVSAVIGTAD